MELFISFNDLLLRSHRMPIEFKGELSLFRAAFLWESDFFNPDSQKRRSLGVCRPTDYGGFRTEKPEAGISSPLQLTPVEKEAVVEKKKLEPQLSHRQISGSLRAAGYWISPSSCYRILKPLGWLSSFSLREAP